MYMYTNIYVYNIICIQIYIISIKKINNNFLFIIYYYILFIVFLNLNIDINNEKY